MSRYRDRERDGNRDYRDRRDYDRGRGGYNDEYRDQRPYNDPYDDYGPSGGGRGGNGVGLGPADSDRVGGGASHLARIHGTEEDRVNCPFYFKIGACRHGDTCSRVHNKPVFSQTVIIPQMYENPIASQDPMSQYHMFASQKGYHDQPTDDDFEEFYMDVFEELSKYGEIEEMVVCDNLCDHLVGNVYVKYFDEEDSAECQKALNGRFFSGRQLKCEFSPVTDFREARCRQYHDNHCSRNGDCNFIHTKRVSNKLVNDLLKLQKFAFKRSNPSKYKEKRSRSGSGSRSGSSSSSGSSTSSSSTSRSGSKSSSTSKSDSDTGNENDKRRESKESEKEKEKRKAEKGNGKDKSGKESEKLRKDGGDHERDRDREKEKDKEREKRRRRSASRSESRGGNRKRERKE